MKNSFISYISIVIGIMSIMLIVVSYYLASIVMLIISIIILVVSILFVVINATYNMFKLDRHRDFEVLKEQGLTVVRCPSCNEKNVLEDKYCYVCGEKLGQDHDNREN